MNCYVYLHLDQGGTVKYIGKGTGKRAYKKTNRSKEWLSLFSDIPPKVIIVKEKLSNSEALELEQSLIREHRSTVVNIKGAEEIKELDFDLLNNKFYVSNESKTGLKWKNTTARHIKNQDAGYSKKPNGKEYYAVVVNGKEYYAHRIVYFLTNRSLSTHLVVNHKDGDGTNNSISNLEAITQRENSLRCKLSKNNTSGHNAVNRHLNRNKVFDGFLVRLQKIAHKGTGKLFALSKYISEEDCLNAALSYHQEQMKLLITNIKENMNKNKVTIDLTKDSLFDALGLIRLKDSYMMEGEVSPQERFAYVSETFGSDPEHAQRLYDYASKHWLSYSTPILAFGRNKRGLPISCFLNYLEDTSEGLVNNLSETSWLSMMGGGVGVHFQIRGTDEKSTGVMPHLKTYDSSSMAYKQGRTRRGSYAAYLDISHPDIIPFLEMRKPTGDQNMKALNLNHGINIPDKFMQTLERCMIDENADDSWELIQPNNGKVTEVVSAKALWMKILELRMQTGEPYLWFIDRANEGLPDYQKKIGLKNYGSNLCS